MKPKIALITGGFTGESVVSLKSAAFVYEQVDKDKYDLYKIVISLYSWYYELEDKQKIDIDRTDFSLTINGEKVVFDLAFIILHGSPGEDGKLQGYLDMIGLPYTSCDALTSAVTMNKAYTKALLTGITDLYLSNSVHLFESQRATAADLVRAKLRLPYFVKPNGGGSSIGMTKVKADSELQEAIDKAFDTENTGKQVLVEEFVTGREFSVGVYRVGSELRVLPPTEVVTTREFFDFEAKYTPGLTQEITPADLNEEQLSRVQRLVKAIYIRLNCKGMVRVDYFLEKGTDKFYFIEINTIPGQTAQSFIPQQVRASGLTEREFYGLLIEDALVS
ncbi:D-alanine--D-alanine ligase [Olivibacter sitiensis]|uniref:D-alanine--D-alanine ligase n=1 Tax=Olivibacter sitiensis TaxID=376470 RepID=UPI000416BADB|nr:D-alanine--D-alanine ligase [Olivibacter sitiensis]